MAGIPAKQTETNLLRAFVCAALASRRHRATAAAIEAEGRGQAAIVLRCLAQRRADQAEAHLRMLDGLDDAPPGRLSRDVGGDVCAAISDEDARRAAYAGMARTARDEGFEEIAEWFEVLAKAGRSHVRRLRGALDALAEQGWIGFGR